MGFQLDPQMARERMRAWWDHEIVDRPVIQFAYRRKWFGWRGWPDYWALIQPGATLAGAIRQFQRKQRGIVHGGEMLPVFNLNYGPGALGATLGIEPRFSGNTAWFEKPTDPAQLLPYLEEVEFNATNKWYARFLQELDHAARVGASATPRFTVGIPSLAGILDTLNFFVDFKTMIVQMHRDPGFIDACRAILQEKLLRLIADCNRAVLAHADGVSNWLRIWGPRSWWVLQEDLAYNLSPRYFRRFVLPDLRAQTETLPYTIYHLDGVNQLAYLDDLLALPRLTGIQWVPGVQAGSPGSLEWLPHFRKVQAAGKNLVLLGVAPAEVKPLYDALDPRGLLVQTTFTSARHARQCLPACILERP